MMNYASRASFPLSLAVVAAIAGAGCDALSIGDGSIDYTMEPQQFAHDFGDPATTAKMPSLACSSDADCTKIPANMLPEGASASCDTGEGKCIATVDVQLFQTINLSQQKTLPAVVLNSPVISVVKVGAVHYWTPTNTLNVTTPAIGLYVGPQSAQKISDAGVVKLGAIPTLAAGNKTACGAGAPGTQGSACDIPLTDAGKSALGVFAKEIKQPFNILIEAPVTVKHDEPFPGGKIDVFLQPVLSFVL